MLARAGARDEPDYGWQNFTMDTDPAPERAPRFYCPGPLAPGAVVDLPDQAAHHVMRVLRMAPDERVRLFDGHGGEWLGAIRSISKAGVSVRVTAHAAREVEAQLRVVLAQGISSRERMDFTVQKAVELGVAEIFPLATRRSVVKLREDRASRRVDHWQHLAIAACEQCGRNRVPTLHPVMDFADWLGTLPRDGVETRVMLSPGATARLAGALEAVRRAAAGRTRGRARSRRTGDRRHLRLSGGAAGTAHPAHRDRRTRRRLGDACFVGGFLAVQPLAFTRRQGRRKPAKTHLPQRTAEKAAQLPEGPRNIE